MKIIFMGTPEFAVPSLEILLESHHEISAVVTTPDKPAGRGLKINESPVKKIALTNNLKVLQPVNLKDEKLIHNLQMLNPDLIVVVAFRILPKEIFIIPKFGSFNLHASLLPKYRGAAPINWAIINGETESGVSTFFLKEKVDTGNIILQNRCKIEDSDNAGSLSLKLAELGAKAVMSTVNLIEMTHGDVPVYEQDESLYTTAPKITREFCKINWDNEVKTVNNFIRGLSPIPTAYTTFEGKIIKIFDSKFYSDNKQYAFDNIFNPGVVHSHDKKLLVECNNGMLEIISLQMEGKKRMSAKEFLFGWKLLSERINLMFS